MSTKQTLIGIPKKKKKALFFLIPLFLSCFMSSIISFISVINSIGFNHQTLHAWLSSWGLAWLIGFSVPIFDGSGRVVAGLNTVARSEQYTVEQVTNRCLVPMQELAKQLRMLL